MAFTSQTFSALEQPTLAKWNILNSNDDDLNARLNTIETLGWVSYTPTLTNLTVGNGTLSAKYMRQSKICTVRFVFTFGTTSSMGTDPTLSLPFHIGCVGCWCEHYARGSLCFVRSKYW
jgi:hypothetical protein